MLVEHLLVLVGILTEITGWGVRHVVLHFVQRLLLGVNGLRPVLFVANVLADYSVHLLQLVFVQVDCDVLHVKGTLEVFLVPLKVLVLNLSKLVQVRNVLNA